MKPTPMKPTAPWPPPMEPHLSAAISTTMKPMKRRCPSSSAWHEPMQPMKVLAAHVWRRARCLISTAMKSWTKLDLILDDVGDSMLARGVQRLPADQLMGDEDLLGASECAAAAGGAAGSADKEGFVCPCGLLLLCPGGLLCPAAPLLCATAAGCIDTRRFLSLLCFSTSRFKFPLVCWCANLARAQKPSHSRLPAVLHGRWKGASAVREIRVPPRKRRNLQADATSPCPAHGMWFVVVGGGCLLVTPVPCSLFVPFRVPDMCPTSVVPCSRSVPGSSLCPFPVPVPFRQTETSERTSLEN